APGTAGLGDATLPMLRSALDSTVVVADAVLLAAYGSPLAASTRAVLTSTVPVCVALATNPTTVIVAVASSSMAPSWQLMPASHIPWLGTAATKLTPPGSASTTWTSFAAAGPLFVTTSV